MTGTLHPDGDRYVLRFERRLPYPPARVWSALTTPDGLAAWFPARVVLDLRVGGRMTFAFTDQDMDAPDGEVVELDEPRVFAFTWNDELLRFELEPDGDGTRLLFAHHIGDRSVAARVAAGWDVCLDALAGDDVSDGRWGERHEFYAEAFDAGADGTVTEGSDGRRRLRFERRLDHSVERVWAALTEPAELERWLARAELDLRPGGALVLRWLNTDDQGRHAVLHGTVTALEPPRLIEYDTDLHGRLRFELLRSGEGTLLTFVNETPAPDDAVPLVLAGWHTHLEHLADVLAGATVDWSRWDQEHRPRWQEHHDRYAARQESATAA